MNKLGKFIVDKAGQHNHPGKNTMIPNAKGRITMKGVNDVLLGIDDQGNKKVMLPGNEYQFPGNNVYEIPLRMKKKQMGGSQNDQQMLMDMIQQYAQAIGADPNQIMQELQAAGPEEQQMMIQEMTAAVSQGMQGSNPFAAEEMQLGGTPEDHMFNPPPQEMYSPMDMSVLEMQMGGDVNQNKGYMNKTNNFVQWLRNKAHTVNMSQMMDQDLSKAQMGGQRGNYMDKNGFYHNVNKEAAYMGVNNQPPYTDYGNYNPVFNPLNGGYNSLFTTQMPVIPSKLPRDMAIQSTTNATNTNKKKSIYNTTTTQNQNTEDIFVEDPVDDATTQSSVTGWQGQWYNPDDNKQIDVTDPANRLSQNVGTGYQNQGYQNSYMQGSGTPYFNFGYSPFGGGLLNFIPNMIMALGSLGRMQGNPFAGGRTGSQMQRRDRRPVMNRNKSINLDYSNDPNNKGDYGDGIKSLEQGKYPNPYMSYEDEIKLLAEQNAPTSADRTNKALDFLKNFKKRPMQYGGDPQGNEIDLQNPDYFNLEYNMHPYGQDIVPEQDFLYTDPNTAYNAAPSAKAPAPNSKGTGFMTGNPFTSEGLISDINAITAMKNQADMAKQDRLQKRELNDVTKNHSVADRTKRGDWFSGPGLGFGMFRPDDNIYAGPNAFAKKGGTFFNGNFFQTGGENEDSSFDDYIEGDEMFLTDAQIQKILDAGGDIEFL